MPISTVCADCRKKYTLKEEMAGKRFRCKECQSIVTVPDVLIEDDEDDPFAGVDLQSEGKSLPKRRRVVEDDDDEDEDDEDDRPVRRPKSKSKPVKKRRPRGDGIPVTAVVAITLQCLLTLFPIVNCFIIVLEDESRPGEKIGSCAGLLTRMAIALCVLFGMFQRKHSSRQWSRGLCGLGLTFGALAIVIIVALGATTDEQVGMIIILSGQWIMWLTMLICLSTESAENWFNE